MAQVVFDDCQMRLIKTKRQLILLVLSKGKTSKDHSLKQKPLVRCESLYQSSLMDST